MFATEEQRSEFVANLQQVGQRYMLARRNAEGQNMSRIGGQSRLTVATESSVDTPPIRTTTMRKLSPPRMRDDISRASTSIQQTPVRRTSTAEEWAMEVEAQNSQVETGSGKSGKNKSGDICNCAVS